MKHLLQLEQLKPEIDRLQEKHGDQDYTALYGTGCIKKPDVMFLFMNPTARNLSTSKTWKGIRASFIGHKQTWKLMNNLGFLSSNIYQKIENIKTFDWTPEFAEEIYNDIAKHKGYITSLARCTMSDARSLPDKIFRDCRDIALKEIELLNPKVIIAFGNQVASNLLQQQIKVSECRESKYNLVIGKKTYTVYPTYYPVGMGQRNMPKAIEDIKNILKNL